MNRLITKFLRRLFLYTFLEDGLWEAITNSFLFTTTFIFDCTYYKLY